MMGVPEYTEPKKYECTDEWEYGFTDTIDVSGIEVEIEQKGTYIYTRIDRSTNEDFWTVVHYLRDMGVPGVAKEVLVYGASTPFRLGGLYMIAGFDLLPREKNYEKYGENPLEAGESLYE